MRRKRAGWSQRLGRVIEFDIDEGPGEGHLRPEVSMCSPGCEPTRRTRNRLDGEFGPERAKGRLLLTPPQSTRERSTS